MLDLKLFIVYIFCVSVCGAKKYDKYALFRGMPVEDRHLEFLQNLSDVYDVNYWSWPGTLRIPVDFVIAPTHKESFLKAADENGIYLTMIMEDIQSAFNKQTVKSYISRRMDTFNWQNYYKTDDIYKWLFDLERAFPHEVRVERIGTSHQNRDILAVTIILKGSLRRSKVIIEGGTHAREWISPAFVTYMIHRIAHANTSSDMNLRMIAKTHEWYFVPILNPDGYEYTHSTDRLWRKNRNGTGIDLNRNFGLKFGTVGISFEKSSDIYCGEGAFSENESSTMARFVESKRENLEYYISFHSYGQYIILPYGYTKQHLQNYDEVHEMGQRAAKKMRSLNEKKYSVGTSSDTVGYTVSGASTCWVKSKYHVPYVMTFELRDDGQYGFALPPSQIIPTCEETLQGVISLFTPLTIDFKPLKKYKMNAAKGQKQTFLDQIVIVFLYSFIFIVWFD